MTSNNDQARRLPLRLCEVLEKEFITTNGAAPANPSWLLRGADVDFEMLIECLRVPSPAQDSSVLALIKKRLVAAGVTVLPTNVWTQQEQQQVVDELNRALMEDLFLKKLDQFESDLEVARLARSWLKTAPAKPPKPTDPLRHEIAAQERLQLNRLLLETVFPVGIVAPIDAVRLSLLFSAIHKLKGTNIRTALCLSGGGIRSAAFSLGVLQGLARCSLLDKFDYLSTVSGGGYVGSWLSAWAHRHPQGLPGVSRELASHADDTKRMWTEIIEPGPAPIRFLRNYSYFLNPKSGLFSLDTWTWLGIYLRNLSLNWLVMIPALLLMLLLPRLYAAALVFPRHEDELFVFGLASAAAILVTICITVNRPASCPPYGRRPPAASCRILRYISSSFARRRCPWDGSTGRDVTSPSATMGARAEVAEWQTRRSQTPLRATSCGFESHLRYHAGVPVPCGLIERPCKTSSSPSGRASSSSRSPRSGRRSTTA